jgi:hypothetical protein
LEVVVERVVVEELAVVVVVVPVGLEQAQDFQ